MGSNATAIIGFGFVLEEDARFGEDEEPITEFEWTAKQACFKRHGVELGEHRELAVAREEGESRDEWLARRELAVAEWKASTERGQQYAKAEAEWEGVGVKTVPTGYDFDDKDLVLARETYAKVDWGTADVSAQLAKLVDGEVFRARVAEFFELAGIEMPDNLGEPHWILAARYG